MLTVLPIQDKKIQEELCKICGAEFDTNSFAYRADDGVFLGICQLEYVFWRITAYQVSWKIEEVIVAFKRFLFGGQNFFAEKPSRVGAVVFERDAVGGDAVFC